MPTHPRTRTELARAIGVHPDTAGRYMANGCPCEPDGSFDPAKVLAWANERRSAAGRGGAEEALIPNDSVREADEKVLNGKSWTNEFRRVKVLAATHELSKKMGEVLPKREVVRMFAQRCMTLAREVEAFPARVAPRCVCGCGKGPTVVEIRELIREEAHRILEHYRSGGAPLVDPDEPAAGGTGSTPTA